MDELIFKPADTPKQLLEFQYEFKSENFEIVDLERLRDYLHMQEFPLFETTKVICKEVYELNLAGWTHADVTRFLDLLSDELRIRRY